MNHAYILNGSLELPTVDQSWISPRKNGWDTLWSELLKTPAILKMPYCTAITVSISTEAMPFRNMERDRTTADMVNELQDFFGVNVTETADILNVSRPMIYHYQKGMEPAIENKRRLLLLNSLVNEWKALDASSVKYYLKVRQPEGKTLLDYLNDEDLNVVAVREVMHRATASDRRIREKLAQKIIVGETPEQKRDIAQRRHAAGKAVYIADSALPNKIVQVLPDGTHVRGNMVNRKFIPDGECSKS